MDLHYAARTMNEVVQHLAKEGPLKERLIDALIDSSFVTIRYPGSYVGYGAVELKNIHKMITGVSAKGLEATFVASIKALTDEEALAVSNALVNYAFATAKEYGVEEGKLSVAK